MVDSKLIVRLKGGLGNQLFCYATGRRLALKSGAELVIDDITGFKYDYQYRRQYALDSFNISARKATAFERLEPFPRIRRFLLKKISERRPLRSRRYIVQNGVAFDEQLLLLRLQTGTTYFDGFGQSERYFEDVEEVIRNDLIIDAPMDIENIRLKSLVESSSAVALHFRWFDNSSPDSPSNISTTYYKQAVELIKSRIPSPHFFIFSDNQEQTTDLLRPLISGEKHTFVGHNTSVGDACKDLWLMSKCRHFVIGNSTFAWWGAWLGERKGDSIVVAPSIQIDPEVNVTAWGFPYLVPTRWWSI